MRDVTYATRQVYAASNSKPVSHRKRRGQLHPIDYYCVLAVADKASYHMSNAG